VPLALSAATTWVASPGVSEAGTTLCASALLTQAALQANASDTPLTIRASERREAKHEYMQ
jgi:hypothetical protein